MEEELKDAGKELATEPQAAEEAATETPAAPAAESPAKKAAAHKTDNKPAQMDPDFDWDAYEKAT